MGDELPSLHGKFKIQGSLLSPSPPCVDERKLVKGLLNLYNLKGSIVNFPFNWKPATANVNHNKSNRLRVTFASVTD
jgi:hypothetical protein